MFALQAEGSWNESPFKTGSFHKYSTHWCRMSRWLTSTWTILTPFTTGLAWLSVARIPSVSESTTFQISVMFLILFLSTSDVKASHCSLVPIATRFSISAASSLKSLPRRALTLTQTVTPRSCDKYNELKRAVLNSWILSLFFVITWEILQLWHNPSYMCHRHQFREKIGGHCSATLQNI